MASLFGHIAVSTAIGYAFFPKQVRPLTLVLAGFCAFAPDLDVLAFRFGVPYQSDWGHRGFTHSLFFTVLVGTLIGWAAQRFVASKTESAGYGLVAWLGLSMVSHPLLDMFTNGGRGCALWWPISSERIFFPVRPIQVSPMSVSEFFGPWGLEVLASEVLWVGFPCVAMFWLAKIMRKG